MRKLLMLAAAGFLLSGLNSAKAEGEKVTLTGEGMCAKCALKETKDCQNAVIVTKDGKKVTYYLVANDVSKAAHSKEGFCMATKDDPIKVKITGTFEKKDDGKLHFTAEKIEKE